MWQEKYGQPPPGVRVSKTLMADCLAYRIQELESGGLSHNARNRLHQINADVRVAHRPGFRGRDVLVPGSRLTRRWAGKAHEVIVTSNHFFYNSERYATLSEIATKITGMDWDGHHFFMID